MELTSTRLTAEEYFAHELAAGASLTTPLLPGFSLDVAGLFDR